MVHCLSRQWDTLWDNGPQALLLSLEKAHIWDHRPTTYRFTALISRGIQIGQQATIIYLANSTGRCWARHAWGMTTTIRAPLRLKAPPKHLVLGRSAHSFHLALGSTGGWELGGSSDTVNTDRLKELSVLSLSASSSYIYATLAEEE